MNGTAMVSHFPLERPADARQHGPETVAEFFSMVSLAVGVGS
jgi:hypothetical protein